LTISSRPVAPRAKRIADIVASVPDETKRTRSQLGTRSQMRRASSVSSSLGVPNDVPLAA
jgi:hypothetical protein